MSHIIVITLAIVSVAFTTCRALPDIHKQMSAQQLQSIFHVESHEAVPQYEVIQLLHHHSEEASPQQYNNYRRRKRSIEPIASTAGSEHVKKDLSKTPYYSAAKMGSSEAQHVNKLEEHSKHKHIKHIKEHKVSMNAFGEKLNLTLKKTQGLFKKGELHNLPMWFADKEANSTQGLNLEKIEDEHSHSSDQIGEVFQDEENMAAILMRHHEITGDLIMEGSIGHDMVIKPLPHELSPSPEESHHVIFKREADANEHLSDFAYMEPDDLATHEKLEKLQERHKRSAHRNTLTDLEEEQERLEAEDDLVAEESSPHKRAKRQAPYMIYPEVLVIVDYDGYRLHGGDNLQVKRYFIAFWNGVDLRYRLLKDPKIRVSIAGIIISRGRDATPYLERNRVGRDAIDSAAALTDMGKYLFRERRLPVYDIAVAITKLDMCRREFGIGQCNRGTAGFAYVGGACVVNRRLEKVNSVAIIEDTGGFSGIIVAAHEVGHLLGAVHDGSPPPSYLGGPGAQRCRWEDGFIMSDLRHTERGFRWSACSVQSFQHFLNGATATCLYNVPHEDNALGRSLPGTLLSLDAQCRRDRGTYACFKDERVCAQLFCFDAQTGYCVAYRPAAEGSSCGNNLHCLDGRCSALQVASNLISNYGGQYRTGYKSNEAIGDENENKTKESPNEATTEEEDDDEEDDEEETDQDDTEDNEDQEQDDQEQANNNSSEEEEEDDEEQQEVDNEENKETNEEYTEESPADEEQESEENTSDASASRENDSSIASLTQNDDDEEYLTEDNNEPSVKDLQKQYDHNHLDRPIDNHYEETMIKRKDNEKQINLAQQQTPAFNLNTYQYLSQLWQNLQTTTTTTKKPLTVLYKQQQLLKKASQGYVPFKTITKSVSNSRTSDSRRITPQHYTDIQTTLVTSTPPATTPSTKTLHISNSTPKTISTTKTATQTPPTTSTLIKTLRKQFQYYMKLLQANSDSTSPSRNSPTTTSTSLYNPNYNSHTILPSKPYSHSLNNSATKHLQSLNKSQLNNNAAGDDDADNEDDDDDDSGDDNDESNETIEKQKRKLTIPINTTTQQQLQLQQASLPTPTTFHGAAATTATTLELSAATTAGPPQQYGIRSASSPTYFDAYVKKLQALNAAASSGTTEASTSFRTTAEDISKTLDKTEKTPQTTSQFVEGQFLKRTLSSTPTLSSFSSNSNKNPYTKQIKSNPVQQTTSALSSPSSSATATTVGSSSSSSSSSNYKYIPQPLKIIQETHADNIQPQQQTHNQQQHHQQHQRTPQTSPGYVTNYIGDNTNRLSSIVQQDHQTIQQQSQRSLHQQQQQTASKQHQQQQEQQLAVVAFSSSSSSTTRRPKIKTQKLIRRLRKQIK